MPSKKPPKYIMDVLARASQEHGIPFSVLRSFAEIESGFRAGAKTGSYNGLFMLSKSEFKRGGGKGSIMNPEANTNAFANVWKKNVAAFENKMGRKPQGWETYLVHQQGVAGGPAHLRNPDKPAWQNMHATPEGRQKGVGWSKKAIWGNVPSTQKKKFGSVNNITSGDFVKLWQSRYARAGGGSAEEVAFDGSAASMEMPERGMRVAGRASDMDVPERRPQSLGVDQNVVMVGGGEEAPPVPQRRNVKFDYRAPEYASANDIGAGGPPPPEKNPQDAPAPPRSAILPGSPELATSGSRISEPTKFGGGGGGFDPLADKAFGAPFGELYGRADQGGSSLLKDVLPSGKPTPVMGQGGVPPRPPMFKDFFQSIFGGFG